MHRNGTLKTGRMQAYQLLAIVRILAFVNLIPCPARRLDHQQLLRLHLKCQVPRHPISLAHMDQIPHFVKPPSCRWSFLPCIVVSARLLTVQEHSFFLLPHPMMLVFLIPTQQPLNTRAYNITHADPTH
ncbi:hypothetical protein EDC04DRAFT_2695462 [Pisolithus marmoratus]|nr:hypothetical protein EDC04DRAFT_2695462 [Pisolithus marmoratus]